MTRVASEGDRTTSLRSNETTCVQTEKTAVHSSLKQKSLVPNDSKATYSYLPRQVHRERWLTPRLVTGRFQQQRHATVESDWTVNFSYTFAVSLPPASVTEVPSRTAQNPARDLMAEDCCSPHLSSRLHPAVEHPEEGLRVAGNGFLEILFLSPVYSAAGSAACRVLLGVLSTADC